MEESYKNISVTVKYSILNPDLQGVPIWNAQPLTFSFIVDSEAPPETIEEEVQAGAYNEHIWEFIALSFSTDQVIAATKLLNVDVSRLVEG